MGRGDGISVSQVQLRKKSVSRKNTSEKSGGKDSISFYPRARGNIREKSLANILAHMGDKLAEIEAKYSSKIATDEKLEKRILDMLEELEEVAPESERSHAICQELSDISEKHFMQKLDFSNAKSFEQLFRILSLGSASKGSMNSKENDRLARLQNILQSQQGELREEALIEIARGNKEISVAQTEIAGPGVDDQDLPGKEKRHIFHRVDPELLKEVSLHFDKEIEKAPRDAAGFVSEEGFARARRKTMDKYAEKLLASIEKNKEKPPARASYDMVLERDGKLALWEIKTSGHLGNKAGQGEYNRLLENTILLSLVHKGEVNPYFGCLERDHRFKSNPNLPAGHSLVADNLLRGILPRGLTWEDYMKHNPYTDDRDPVSEVKFAKFLRAATFREKVAKMSDAEKKARLNKEGSDFKNSFLGE